MVSITVLSAWLNNQYQINIPLRRRTNLSRITIRAKRRRQVLHEARLREQRRRQAQARSSNNSLGENFGHHNRNQTISNKRKRIPSHSERQGQQKAHHSEQSIRQTETCLFDNRIGENSEYHSRSKNISNKRRRLSTNSQTQVPQKAHHGEQRRKQALDSDNSLGENSEHQNRNKIVLHCNEKLNRGFSYNKIINYASGSDIGKMNCLCIFCNSKKFESESQGFCCSSRKVQLEPIRSPPGPLKSLLNGKHEFSKQFIKLIRHYNNAFQFTSFGANEIIEGK